MRTHFSSQMTLNIQEIIAEVRNYVSDDALAVAEGVLF